MNRKLSLASYKVIDLTIFSILTIIFEFLGVYFLNKFEFPSFCLSIFLSISLICMMRWKLFAFIIPILSGLIYCLAIGGNVNNYYIYIIGNSFVLVNLIWFVKCEDKIRDNNLYTVLYVISGYLLICFGRSFIAFILGENFLTILVSFLGTETLNLALGIIIICIAKKQKGLFVDQIKYLKELQEEIRNENNYSGKEQ